MAQQIIKRSSVILIRYPFTDLTDTKVRPAIVLTPDQLIPRLEDVLCLFISSVMPEELFPTDFVLRSEHPSFLKTGLKHHSVLRAHKLALFHKSLILRVLGEMDADLMNEKIYSQSKEIMGRNFIRTQNHTAQQYVVFRV